MKKDSRYIKLKKTEPLLHLLFWGIVLLFPYVKFLGREGGYPMSFPHELVALFFNSIPTYIMYLWFFPLKNKQKYILLVLLLFIGNAFFHYYADSFFHMEEDHKDHRWRSMISSLVTYTSFSLGFFALFSVKKLYAKQLELETTKQEKQQAELSALKAQVNPHFLFNTLNNIYANALKKDEKTPDLILKLSDSFRYLLHEGQKKQVTLDKEITHIKDYISLQEERLSTKVKVSFLEDIHNPQKEIAPLLLIPFIENAFKYTSTLKGRKHLIKIKTILNEAQFYFYCENSYNENKISEIETNWKESGIGIKNTKKRLQLLYPKQHQLLIEENDNLFKVTLTIIL
ncbi:histidine kinase [uncultured Aquimarina sp.]|uniref:sensor histidine kinase n=1 Tax=uncultured Aquimarina sp. TaxID=575652 RepID=UPI002607B22E|nr:histidine kinase [uncultured Aquimarina sp.]